MSVLAQYHGQCSECEFDIVPGQLIERDDDEWRHVDCAAMPEAIECVCQRCFLVHAGACF